MSKGLFDRLQGELEAREKSPGLRMSDLLTLPEPTCSLLQWMIRKGQVTLAEAGAFLQQEEEQAHALLDHLVERGYARQIEIRGRIQYRVRLAPKPGRALPSNLWQALEEKVEGEEEGRP